MGFMLNMIEDMAGLTDQEKSQLEPMLPDVVAALKTANAALPEMKAANDFYVQAQPLIKRLLDDLTTLAPNAIALLSDGDVNIGEATGAVRDAEGLYKNNPAYLKTLQAHYNTVVPVINRLKDKWPKVEPAYQIVAKALARKNATLGSTLKMVHDKVKAERKA
jgi:hypothetical protein